MSARMTGSIAFLSVLCILLQSPIAQDFVRIDDERYIQLALDMIRKGVQQEDTAKVLAVFASEVRVNPARRGGKGGKGETRAVLNQKLQALFEESSRRTHKMERPLFARMDNPLRSSDYWDFDILEPRITIKGDSAFVDCRLVLWGSSLDATSKNRGRKVSERFVFISPHADDPAPLPDNTGRWPSTPILSRSLVKPKGWMLVQYNELLEFLEAETRTGTVSKDKKVMEER